MWKYILLLFLCSCKGVNVSFYNKGIKTNGKYLRTTIENKLVIYSKKFYYVELDSLIFDKPVIKQY